ncbi:MAG: phospholipid carrier-dependent glycosyltransferase [bacterium]|nr:phospholipid carrier-dependent glycosyltransferase [bacterium]
MRKKRDQPARNRRGKDQPAIAADPGKASGHWTRVADIAAPIAASITFFVLVWTLYPLHTVLSFSPDEGNNVIKALMMSRGHSLYAEIWSDQPPLFTWMLRLWMGATDWSVPQARILVLICASVLLWSLYQTVRLSWGHGAALAAVVMLALTEHHIRLSASVMLAVPTLMFVMLAVYALAKYWSSPRTVWLVLSSVCFCLGLFTKLIAALVAPPIVLVLLLCIRRYRRESAGRLRRWQPAMVWAGALALTGTLLVLVTIRGSALGQLIAPHADDKRVVTADTAKDAKYAEVFEEMVLADGVYALLGIVGVAHVVRRREWFSLLPALWCGLALVALHGHRPLWYHHYMLMTIPICWAAGIGVGPLLSGAQWRSILRLKTGGVLMGLGAQLSAGVLLIVALLGVPSKVQRIGDFDFEAMTTRDRHIVALMRAFKEHTRYAMSDRQILPFSAGLIVPPELSVTSRKRMRGGHLSPNQLVDILERYEPEQIFISWRRRIPVTDELNRFLDDGYILVYHDAAGFARGHPGARFYVLRRLEPFVDEALQDAMAEVPASPEAVCNWGWRCLNTGRYAEAIEHLDGSIRLQPTLPAYRGLGQALEKVERLEEALIIYEKLLRILSQATGTESETAQVRAKLEALRPSP